MADRRFFAPEVIQTSEMDCGPATLKSILEGFGIAVSYGRLREACQTDVDGTSIDTIEEVALQLGLAAEQTMMPEDHLLLPEAEALPAIVITRNPGGLTHFVVVWRLHGPLIQVMDPGKGRRWLTKQSFLQQLYIHTQPVPAEMWRAWAGSAGFCDPLQERLVRLGFEAQTAGQLIDLALEDPGWFGPAALDATTRMVTALVQARGVRTGPEAAAILERFFRNTLTPGDDAHSVPTPYWSVRSAPPGLADADQGEILLLRGAVLVRMLGPADDRLEAAEVDREKRLSPELVAALEESPTEPLRELWNFLKQDGLLPLGLLVGGLAVTAASGIVEILLLRGLLDIGQRLGTDQRMAALVVLFAFAVGVLFLQLPVQTTILRIGRRLETRMRVAFLSKIPRLNDRYFQSRLISDMTQRARDLGSLGGMPRLGATFVQTVFQLLLTLFAVIVLDPKSLLIAVLATISAVALSIISNPFLVEQDLRLRTHIAALSRFYLDSLLGLVAIRTHGAESTVRREHEALLVEWARTSFAMVRTNLIVDGVSGLVSTLFSVWLLLNYIAQGGSASGVLLIFFWTLNLPRLGQQLTQLIQQYPLQRNRILRFLEPLGAPEDPYAAAFPAAGDAAAAAKEATPPAVVPVVGDTVSRSAAVGLIFDQVTVQAAGHTILSDINFSLAPGSHLAIVGASGAGKSSLVGLLLGWHRPASGHVLVDGVPLTEEKLRHLRRETAWVDPAIQLWNRSFVDNLRYGATDNNPTAMSGVIEQADLLEVLERMPNGLQTSLGEGGGLVSGGEGQRVRLGRAMLRPEARLVILDEPFRGLDRTRRRELLAKTRQVWAGATLICITHDVSQTQDFRRVLVIEDGRVIEDASPAELVSRPGSRYSALLGAERAVHESLWASASWRRLYMADGRLTEQAGREEVE